MSLVALNQQYKGQMQGSIRRLLLFTSSRIQSSHTHRTITLPRSQPTQSFPDVQFLHCPYSVQYYHKSITLHQGRICGARI